MTEATRIQCALTDLGLPNEYWAYRILFELCNDVMHARVRQFSAENPPYAIPPILPAFTARSALRPDAEDLKTDKAQDVRRGLDELQAFIGNLTDDDTSYEKRCRMLDTISDCLKLA